MKNSSDNIWNRTSDLPICSTAPYPLCYHGPRNEEGREFKIFIVVRSANCSLRFHGFRIRSVYEGDSLFQGIFSMFKCLEARHIFP
jgi:hypothetical protein